MELRREGAGFDASPGQFVNVLAAGGVTDPLLRVPLGIHRIRKNGIALFYKVVGKATGILSRKRKGDPLDILGPLGRGFYPETGEKEEKKINVLVAGGHGAAPLYALAQREREKGKEVAVFLGASTKKHIVLSREFRQLGCRVKTATEDGSAGRKGYVTCLLEDLLKQKNGEFAVYSCGPTPMLARLAELAAEKGIRARVSVDTYMACGTGVCRGCAIMTREGYKLSCTDGPVFYSDEIVWEEKLKGCGE